MMRRGASPGRWVMSQIFGYKQNYASRNRKKILEHDPCAFGSFWMVFYPVHGQKADSRSASRSTNPDHENRQRHGEPPALYK